MTTVKITPEFNEMIVEQNRFYDAFRELFTSGKAAGKTSHELLQMLMLEASHVMYTSKHTKPEFVKLYGDWSN